MHKCGSVLLMLVVTGVLASPASAADPLFTFGFTDLNSSWDGSDFTTDVDPSTTVGSLGNGGSAIFIRDGLFPGFGWSAEGGDFSLKMNLTDVTANTAQATGDFIITDVDGDTITGLISGEWQKGPTANTFAGGLSGVTFNKTGGGPDSFDGHNGSFIMMAGFSVPSWTGTLIELSSTGTWFGDGTYSDAPASIDASVVPAPGAALLAFIGLGTVNWVRRRLA